MSLPRNPLDDQCLDVLKASKCHMAEQIIMASYQMAINMC